MDTSQDNFPAEAASRSGPVVAVIDDDRDLCELYHLVLQRNGFACKVFVGGQAFMDFIDQGKDVPQLVICDFTMPEVDGSDIIGKIRSHPDYAGTKVLFCSGI